MPFDSPVFICYIFQHSKLLGHYYHLWSTNRVDISALSIPPNIRLIDPNLSVLKTTFYCWLSRFIVSVVKKSQAYCLKVVFHLENRFLIVAFSWKAFKCMRLFGTLLFFWSNEISNTLDLQWRTNSDFLGYSNKTAFLPTKRTILSGIVQIFDTLSSSVTIIKVKILMQRLWLEKLDQHVSLDI